MKEERASAEHTAIKDLQGQYVILSQTTQAPGEAAAQKK